MSAAKSRFSSTSPIDKRGRRANEDGLLLHTSASAGQILSDYEASQRYMESRKEYVKATKRRILPKVVALANRLAPIAAKELGGAEVSEDLQFLHRGLLDRGRSSSEDIVEKEFPKPPLKSTGLDDENDTTSGESKEEASQLRLPLSAASAAVGSDFDATDGEGMTIDDIAARLGPDTALIDIEAEALLESIRSETLTTMEKKCEDGDSDDDSDDHNFDIENRSFASSLGTDDDDVGREIRQLSSSMVTLQRDLEAANLEDMVDDRSIGETWSGPGRTSILWDVKIWNILRWQGGSADRPAGLYKGVALLWAVAILLAGHVNFNSEDDGELSSWRDVLDWLLFRSGRKDS